MLNCVSFSQAALTQLIQYYHRFQKILSQHPFKRLPIRSELINIHHVMVEVKKHKTTFWMINEWTSLAWVACFPITDHVKFSREMFFYPSGNRSLIYTRLKARILKGIIACFVIGLQTVQKKGLLTQRLGAFLGLFSHLVSYLVNTYDLQQKMAAYWDTKTDSLFPGLSEREWKR